MDLDTPLPIVGIRRKVDQLDVGPLCLVDEDHYPRKVKKCRRTDEDVEQVQLLFFRLVIRTTISPLTIDSCTSPEADH